MVPWPPGPREMLLCFSHCMWCDVLHSAWAQNVILVCFIYSFSLSLKVNLCLLWRWAQLEKKYKETEVVSGMSQLGITVKSRFVGGLKKRICNFPPLISTAVWNSYLSPLSFGFHFLFPFFYPCVFNFTCLDVQVFTYIVCMLCDRLCCLFLY